jgi:hypothetical protein
VSKNGRTARTDILAAGLDNVVERTCIRKAQLGRTTTAQQAVLADHVLDIVAAPSVSIESFRIHGCSENTACLLILSTGHLQHQASVSTFETTKQLVDWRLNAHDAHSTLQSACKVVEMDCQALPPEWTCQTHLHSFNFIAKDVMCTLSQQINAARPACSQLEDHETIGSEKLMDIRTRSLIWTGNLGVMHTLENPFAQDDTLRRLFHLSSLITRSATRDRFVRAELKRKLQMCETHEM